jgi:hypothetical protein
VSYSSVLIGYGSTKVKAFWQLLETSGTAAADSSGNARTLTLAVATGLNAAGFVNGLATSLQGNAAADRGGRSNAAAFDLTTFAAGVWWRPTSSTPASSPLIGRQNSWGVRALTDGRIQASLYLGVTLYTLTSGSALTGATSHLVGIQWDGTWLQLMIDGAPDGYPMRLSGTMQLLANFTYVGGDAGQFFDGRLSGAFIAQPLERGEWVELFEQGFAGTLPTGSHRGLIDNISDVVIPALASQAVLSRCCACGGTIRTHQRRIVSGTKAWHPNCYAAMAVPTGIVAPPTAGTTVKQWDALYTQSIHTYGLNVTERPTSDAKFYWDSAGTPAGRFRQRTDLSGGQSGNWDSNSYGGFMAGLGVLHRFTGGGNSICLQHARKIMDFLASVQTPVGQPFAGWFFDHNTSPEGVSHYFIMHEAPIAALLFWPDLTATERAYWLDILNKGAEALWDEAQDFFYINGNEELSEYLTYAYMYKLTGASKWAARRESQWTWAIAPSGGGNGLTGGLTNASFGLYKVTTTPALSKVGTNRGVDPTTLNLTTDGCFFAEGTAGSGVPAGYDTNYLGYQATLALGGYAVLGDARMRYLANCMVNVLMPRVNKTGSPVTGLDGATPVPSWNLDQLGGSRHNYVAVFSLLGTQILDDKDGRGLLTAAQRAAQFPVVEADYNLNTTQQGPSGTYRSGWFVFGLPLSSSPNFPGFRF